MTEKIDWYKEVLELEPHSRLFFPLARMLAEEQRVSEALSCLKDGLSRHPEFMEARLLYVELLYRSGAHKECAQQVALVERALSGYAGFWEAWGTERVASAGDDAGWALAFLAAVFGRKQISLQAVMEQGLAALLGGTVKAAPAGAADVAPVKVADAASAVAADAVPRTVSAVPPPVVSAAAAPRMNGAAGDTGIVLAPAVAVSSVAAPLPEDAVVPEAVSRQNALLEEVTLRTRSMADVLAEQGDVQGALDIYTELKKNAAAPDVFMDLQRRIDALTARLEEDEQPARTGQTAPASATGKDKLISMLEALAERVEARAQS